MGRGVKKTQDEFVAEARKVHEGFYSYENSVYIGSDKPITITCPKHGEFKTRAAIHLAGSKCRKCVAEGSKGAPAKPHDSFMSEVLAVHGDKYGYDRASYVNWGTRVTITCKIHGDFSQLPATHLRGGGCRKCAGISRGLKRKKTLEQFIQDVVKVHENDYLFNDTVYVNDFTKVLLCCKKHGNFVAVPSDLLQGKGCPECGLDLLRGPRKSTDDFIEACTKVHDNRYDYSKCVYLGSHEYITVTCADHGDFTQQATSHISGTGCPSCAISGFKDNLKSVFYIYLFGDYVGFGISNKLQKRHSRHMRSFRDAGISDAILHKTFSGSGTNIKRLESLVKRNFKKYIFDTGVWGFRREALFGVDVVELEKFATVYLTQHENSDTST